MNKNTSFCQQAIWLAPLSDVSSRKTQTKTKTRIQVSSRKQYGWHSCPRLAAKGKYADNYKDKDKFSSFFWQAIWLAVPG